MIIHRTQVNIFKWGRSSSSKAIWISDLKQPKIGSNLVKVTIFSNENSNTKVGEALVKFNKKGATIIKWIKPLT